MRRVLALVAAAAVLLAANPAAAQAAPSVRPPAQRPQPVLRYEDLDPLVRPAVDRLRVALGEVARTDRELMPADGLGTLRAADDAVLDQRARARARVMAGLDELLAAGPRGRTAIRFLAAEWTGNDPVQRAEVRAAILAADHGDALALVDRLALTAPRDTQFLRWRADALDALGRPADALRTRQARFELAPGDEAGWEALLRAHEANGSLPRLREHLARLRLVYPASAAIREHEIEVLHRLGRRDEAARLAADTTGRMR